MLATTLTGCNLFDDYFTVEGKYFRMFTGHYSTDGVCEYVYEGENMPDLILLDHFMVGTHNCGIELVKKNGETFTIKSYESCRISHKISDWQYEEERVPPITLKVKRLSRTEIEASINDTPPQVFKRCEPHSNN